MGLIPWALSTEPVVGRGHATLPDVTNRAIRFILSISGFDPDAIFPGLYGPVYNAKAFGAAGNGVRNDRVEIQAAIDACGLAGGGVVFLPGAVYMVDFAIHPVSGAYAACLVMRPNVILRGAGRSATTIKQIAGSTFDMSSPAPYIITNRNPGGGDENSEVHDLTVDGNGANHPSVTVGQNGIIWVRARNMKCVNVDVINVKGTSNAPPGETFHFDSVLCQDPTWINCRALGTAGTQGSGFSADSSVNPTWVGCRAIKMSAGMGFTQHKSRGGSTTGCHAYLNGSNGFNCEECSDVTYVGNVAGGFSVLDTFFYTPAQSLGNAGAGFVLLGTARATLTGNVGSYNSSGLLLNPGVGTYGPSSGRATGNAFTNNTHAGVSVIGTAWSKFKLSNNDLSGNIDTAIDYPGPTGYVVTVPGQVSIPPAVPATGVGTTNNYPFRVTIYTQGGTGTLVQINGANVATTVNGVFTLEPGMTLSLFYSVAPTWTWFASA